MQASADPNPNPSLAAQVAVAREWERQMNRLFKGILPKSERRKNFARK